MRHQDDMTRATPVAIAATTAASIGLGCGHVGGRFWALAESENEDDDDGIGAGEPPEMYSPTPSDVICEAFNPEYSKEEVAMIVDNVVPCNDPAREGLNPEDKVELV